MCDCVVVCLFVHLFLFCFFDVVTYEARVGGVFVRACVCVRLSGFVCVRV